jgi:N-acetylglucosaminyldiphosphoundecaprenol N-acetyl-beta-D-mannosaminyltransferase
MELIAQQVLGVPLARTDYAGAVAWVLEAAQQPAVTAVEAANTHVVTLARHDARFGAAMRRFDVLLPDGMPLVWCINRRLAGGERLRDRVYGPTFMLRCLAATTDGQAGHFLLGGSQELLSALRLSLERRFPGVRILGEYAPPFGEWGAEENQRIFDKIAVSGARLIWVGLGCPKQEYWISDNKERLPSGVYFGIGAAFAFHAGLVRQAPAWMQNAGLEWLYRICAEPRRLLKRYLVYNSLFLFYLLLGRHEDSEGKIGE